MVTYESYFSLHITHVKDEGPFLKICGHVDKSSTLLIERLLQSVYADLDRNPGPIPNELVGAICLAKYNNACYRVQLIGIVHPKEHLVHVHFIDYGNQEVLHLSNLHFLDNSSRLLQIPVAAADFYLYGIRSSSNTWNPHSLLKLKTLLCHRDHNVFLKRSKLPLISIMYKENNLTQYLLINNVGVSISAEEQEILLLATLQNNQERVSLKNLMNIPPPLINKDTKNEIGLVAPKNQPPPLYVPNNIAVVSGTPQLPVYVKTTAKHTIPTLNLPPAEFVNYPPPTMNLIPTLASPMNMIMPPCNIRDYNSKQFQGYAPLFKSKKLDINSRHNVLVTHVDPDSVNFIVHFESDMEQMDAMMYEINKRSYCYLKENQVIGKLCLAKIKNKAAIARALITSVGNLSCKLYFIDFGDEYMVQYYDMFTMPDELLQVPAFANKLCLSGVNNIQRTKQFENDFRTFVRNKILTLKMVAPEGPPLLQYGELYYNNENILSLLPLHLKFNTLNPWNVEERVPVVVSFVDSCGKLFVQPASAMEALDGLMEAVKTHCAYAKIPRSVAVGSACCALFPNDGGWYRAKVLRTRGQEALVSYVDYGNEQEVNIGELRTITIQLLALPVVAKKCALEGFEDLKEDLETSSILESMVLERVLMADVVGVSKDTMLIRLTDANVNPPLDIANAMTENMKQLKKENVEETSNEVDIPKSQPKGNTIQSAVTYVKNSVSVPNWNNERDIIKHNHDGKAEVEITSQRQGNKSMNETQNKHDQLIQVHNIISNKTTPRSRPILRENKQVPNPVPLNKSFLEHKIELDSQLEVSVTWLTNPTSFYIHIMSLQNDFMNMMCKIPEIYNDIDPYKGVITEGASVLARYPQDGVLYRATIVSCQPFGKYAVQYIDFGNKFLVDAKDIWQLDEELMSVPKMAIHCSLLGVDAPEGEWKPNTEVDNCFNAPRYQCVFQAADEEKYHVSMWNNGVSVADTLVENKLAVMTQQVPSVTLKDEPIDLTVVVGQEIVCRVTHVESYEKFFIQLDVMKADLVKSTLADYDKSLLCPLPAAAVVEGQHCILVRDEVVYRAILLSPVEAALPDLGSKLSVSPEELMTLPPELSVYYYQSLECCFNNHTSDCRETMTLDELKEALTGNKFILYINKLDNVKLVVTLYSLGGKKINVLEPDEDTLDAVSPMCHHAVFSSNFGNAYISHMDSLNCLYLRKTSDSDRLAAFLDEMFRFYEQGEPEALTTFETEGVCAAKSSDSNWYRVRIQNVTENVCEVKFLDYGNTEEVPKDLLKKLDPKFYEPCAFALEVTLELIAIQDDALSKLTEWTNNKETQVTLSVNGDKWMANLNLDGVDLCMRLLDEKLAISNSLEIQNQEAVPEKTGDEQLLKIS